MLQPKKHKFRKAFKGRISGDAKGGTALNFGSYGLKAMEPEPITARQIEARRRAGQAGPYPVRARRRSGPSRRGSVQPRGDEAADQDQGRRPPRRRLAPGRRMMAQSTKFED